MGLDMYLIAEQYVSGFNFQSDPEKAQYTALTQMFGVEPCEGSPGATVSFNVAYWRKANAIHKWFVDNVQGGIDECQRSYVERDQLVTLRDLCQKVLDSSRMEVGMLHSGTQWSAADGKKELYEPGEVIANPEVAQELLPTTSGFFFGGTGYNEWYVADLKRTIEQIDRVLKLSDEWEFYYRSSW